MSPQDASPLALVVRFTLRPGAEERFDALVTEIAAGIRDHEPGTLAYVCHMVQDHPRQRIFYELYRDQAAFEAHEQGAHMRRFFAERDALLETKEVDRLTVADGKTPAAGQAASPDA